MVDALEDDWYSEANATQLRGEISWKAACVHEWGYRFTANLKDDEVRSPIVNGQFDTFEGFNLNAFFYRRRLTWTPGGLVTAFAGFTGQHGADGNNDGFLGADAQLPLSDFVTLRSSAMYLRPDDSPNNGADDAWNVGIQLVFNLRGVRPGCPQTNFTPLLDVAGNGNFILNRASTR